VLGGETLLSPGDDERYGKALAEELASWACHMDDARIASRFVWRIEDADLPDLARHLTASCPTLIAKLSADMQQALTDAAGSTAQAPAAATP
jgi:hypothetical protein